MVLFRYWWFFRLSKSAKLKSPNFSDLNGPVHKSLMFMFSPKLWERYVQCRKWGELSRDVQIVDDRSQLCKALHAHAIDAENCNRATRMIFLASTKDYVAWNRWLSQQSTHLSFCHCWWGESWVATFGPGSWESRAAHGWVGEFSLLLRWLAWSQRAPAVQMAQTGKLTVISWSFCVLAEMKLSEFT